jgi:hypothetical protein
MAIRRIGIKTRTARATSVRQAFYILEVCRREDETIGQYAVTHANCYGLTLRSALA